MKYGITYHPSPRRDRAALFIAIYGAAGLVIFAIVAIYHILS